MIQGWAKKDSDELLDWLEKQPSSDDLDKSIVQANDYLFDEDLAPEALTGLANKIKNDELRKSTLARIKELTTPETDSDY